MNFSATSSVERDAFGIALSSPGLCSPGLMGVQGWSPCSSVYEESDEEDQDSHHRRRADVMLDRTFKQRRHTLAWPMPPVRIPITRPLSLGKPATQSARPDLARSMASRRSSAGTGFYSPPTSESSAATQPDEITWRHVNPLSTLTDRLNNRRFFSAPAPELDTIDDDVRIVGGDEFDQTLPLLPLVHARESSDWQDEEKVKMDRLQASFSLLGVQSGPRAGRYQSMTSTCSPESHASSSAAEEEDSYSPTSGLCLLRMALSPEHKAPSLAEQMAFATGLGNMYSWASPMKQAYASSDDYLQTLRARQSIDSMHSIQPFAVQQERSQASRHIRQVVAANAALSHSQSLAKMDSADDTITKQVETDDEFSEEEQGALMNEERFTQYFRSNTPNYSTGHHSLAASTVISANSSPIMHGALSASTFGAIAMSSVPSSSVGTSTQDSEGVASPSTYASSLHSSYESTPLMAKEPLTVCNNDKAYSDVQGDRTAAAPSSISPVLADEFSYLADNDAFLATMQGSPQQTIERSAPHGHWPDAHGFNGNTLSPCLNTPELGLVRTPPPMHAAPTPYLEGEEGDCTTLEATDGHEELGFPSQMVHSSSTTSVLERPRPIPNSHSSAFFSHNEVHYEHHRVVVKKRSPTKASVKPGEMHVEEAPSTKKHPSMPHGLSEPVIPARKTSLEMLSRPGSMASCISFKDEPHPRHLLRVVSPGSNSADGRLPTSMSTGSLGPKALAQVREACRLKAVYLRGSKLLDTHCAEEARVPPVPVVPTNLRSSHSTGVVESITSAVDHEAPSHKRTSVLPRPLRNRAFSQPSHEQDVKKYVVPPQPTSSGRLPTLFVARTPSQRKRGTTGIPATEPSNLALAKLGIRTNIATRSSTVHALAHPLEDEEESLGNGERDARRFCSLADLDPALAIAANVQSSLAGMPDGFVLVVEEKQTSVDNVLVA